MDAPEKERKHHREPTPTLGGVGIFFGFVLSVSLMQANLSTAQFPIIIAALTLLFVVGIKDDLTGVAARKKLLIQLISAALLVYVGDVYIPEMGGLFGLKELPGHVLKPFSVFAIVIILNAYNLIDGVDGLAASIGIIASITFGMFLFVNSALREAIIAFALAGSLLGFLLYNYQPARIFMGDTGSMVVGFLLAMVAFYTMQVNVDAQNVKVPASAVMAFGVLIIPMFDTLRVIIIRIKNRQSTFKPDTNHMHHVLIRTGYSHRGVVTVMVTANVIIIATAVLFRESNVHVLFTVMLIQAMLVLPIASYFIKILHIYERKTFNKYAEINSPLPLIKAYEIHNQKENNRSTLKKSFAEESQTRNT